MRPRAVHVGIAGVLVASCLAISASPVAADDSTETAPSVLSAPVQFAQVDGATLGCRVAGSGIPLVLIPGSANTMAEWDPRFLDELVVSRKVIVFDNRGAGTSAGDVSDLTIQLMARDTAQLIDQVAGGPADVLGWSMGGYVAQELAIRNPARVRRLVLASTDCGGPTTIGPTPRALRILTDPRATTDERMSILFPKSRQGAASAWTDAVGAAFAVDGYQPSNAFLITPKVAKAQNRAAGPTWLGSSGGTCSRAHRIAAHTLVAGGRDDVVVPIVNLRRLAEGIPSNSTVTYRQAGHAFVFQPGLRFAQTVTAFLDQLA